MDLKANDPVSWLVTVWDALEGYRENCIPEGHDLYDEQWNDICTAMAWIAEELEITNEELV